MCWSALALCHTTYLPGDPVMPQYWLNQFGLNGGIFDFPPDLHVLLFCSEFGANIHGNERQRSYLSLGTFRGILLFPEKFREHSQVQKFYSPIWVGCFFIKSKKIYKIRKRASTKKIRNYKSFISNMISSICRDLLLLHIQSKRNQCVIFNIRIFA